MPSDAGGQDRRGSPDLSPPGREEPRIQTGRPVLREALRTGGEIGSGGSLEGSTWAHMEFLSLLGAFPGDATDQGRWHGPGSGSWRVDRHPEPRGRHGPVLWSVVQWVFLEEGDAFGGF